MVPKLVVQSDLIQLKTDEYLTLQVTSGSGEYKAIIESVGIASAVVDDEVVTVKGIQEGETTLVIKDRRSQEEVTIPIVVANEKKLLVSHREIEMIYESYLVVAVTNGSGNLTAEIADQELATASTNENNIIIHSIKPGNTTLTVTDAEQGLSRVIPVKITHIPIRLDKNEVTMPIESNTAIAILSGSGDYTVTIDKPEVASAELVGKTINVEGLNVGEATITLLDNFSQMTREIPVTITYKPIVLSPDGTIVTYPNTPLTVDITSGNGEYILESLSPEIFAAELNGERITINPLAAGKGEMKIVDKVSGEEKIVDVWINELPEQKVFFDVEEIVLRVGEKIAVNVTQDNSGAWYLVWESNSPIISLYEVDWSGHEYEVTAVKPGKSFISVKYWGDTIYAIIPVTVTE